MNDESEQAFIPQGGAIGGGYAGNALDTLAHNRRHRMPTVREQIGERLKALEAQVEKHKQVLALLDEAPGVEKVMDAIRSIGV